MNIYALLLGISVILIPNALFGLWLVWVDLNGNGTLTERGNRYITVIFTAIGGVMVTALMGIIGYIETAGM